MAQLPIGEKTYSRLTILKAKSVIEREGKTVTWDDVISAAVDICEKYGDCFLTAVRGKNGKSKPSNGGKRMKKIVDIKEKLKKGQKVTSEDLNKAIPPKVMKEDGNDGSRDEE